MIDEQNRWGDEQRLTIDEQESTFDDQSTVPDKNTASSLIGTTNSADFLQIWY